MKKIKYYIFPIILIAIFYSSVCSALDGVEDTWGKEINQNQPVSVGDLIYEDGVRVSGMMLGNKYIYTGIENNNLKVEYTRLAEITNEIDEEKEKSVILSLALNANKQTLLKIRRVREPHEMELLLSVVDDFSKIKIEQYKGKNNNQ